MAFSSTITAYDCSGDKIVHYGTYTNTSGSTGGDIDTGLREVDYMSLTVHDSSTHSASPSVDADFTTQVSGDAVTIVTVADENGYWKAVGTY